MRPFSLLLVTVFLFSAVALAHGGAEVSAYPTAVAPGKTLAVEGGDLNPNGPIALFLNGLEGSFRLGEAQGDADGGFKVNLTLPAGIPPGSYVLKASGSNGTSASAELTVTASDGSSATPEKRTATAELMALNRSRSGGEWLVVLTLLGLSALGGLVLSGKHAG